MGDIERTAEQEVERLRGVLALIVAAPEYAHGYATAALSVEVRLVPSDTEGAVEALRRIAAISVERAVLDTGAEAKLRNAVAIASGALNAIGGGRP